MKVGGRLFKDEDKCKVVVAISLVLLHNSAVGKKETSLLCVSNTTGKRLPPAALERLDVKRSKTPVRTSASDNQAGAQGQVPSLCQEQQHAGLRDGKVVALTPVITVENEGQTCT